MPLIVCISVLCQFEELHHIITIISYNVMIYYLVYVHIFTLGNKFLFILAIILGAVSH